MVTENVSRYGTRYGSKFNRRQENTFWDPQALLTFQIRRYRLDSGRSRSLYLFIRRTMHRLQKWLRHVSALSYIQNSIQPPAVKVNFTRGGHYWGSSVRIRSKLLIKYSAFVKTSPMMAIKEGRASAVHKRKYSLRFSNKKRTV